MEAFKVFMLYWVLTNLGLYDIVTREGWEATEGLTPLFKAWVIATVTAVFAIAFTLVYYMIQEVV